MGVLVNPEGACHRAFGRIDPDDQRCVPHCDRFIECYNRMQEEAIR